MLTRFFKRNSILLTFSLFYVLAVGLVLLEIDRQYYQVEKRNIINQDIGTFLHEHISEDDLAGVERLAIDLLTANQPETRVKLNEQIREIVNSPSIIYRIAIQQEDGRAAARPESAGGESAGAVGGETGHTISLVDIRSERDKLTEFNNFSNSLFLRNFSALTSRPIEYPQGHVLARLVITYTTPRGNPRIQELTTRYRWASAFIVAIMTLLAVALARSLLLPLRSVVTALEGSTPARTLFVRRPHSRIETLYNRMAQGAVLARLQGQLREQIASHSQMTGWEAVVLVCQAFAEQFELPLVACLELVAEGPGRIRATGQRVIASQRAGRQKGSLDSDELAATLDALMPRDGREQERFVLPDLTPPLEGALELLSDPERTGIRYLFALGLDARTDEAAFVSLTHLNGRLADLVESALQTLSLRNQLLVQERGRANISLSRNLGHDLTNIIATSKLELMALDRLLSKGEAPADERRRTILVESLHGLLRSIRFMQETVNLYRAYAFLQHPVLEITDGNKLAEETLDLFNMSISAKVKLTCELAPEAPRCVVDPRLIKLALFNLFANALEAIRKTDPERSVSGWIRVVTRGATEGGLCIAVEDSGTGITNAAGLRAEAHEIEKIFELGYTSRRAEGSQGEGLGLNWVRTIVQDLHAGTIFAENMDEGTGGARFVIQFPPIDAAPRTSTREEAEEAEAEARA